MDADQTFVMCGACPYHDRCKLLLQKIEDFASEKGKMEMFCATGVFLHDPRLRSLAAKEPRRASGSGRLIEQKSEEFWWPDMEVNKRALVLVL